MEDVLGDFFIALGTGVIILMCFGIVLFIVSILTREKKPENIRQIVNRQIIGMLWDYVNKNPDQRFGQVLRNIGVVQDVGVKNPTKPEWETPDYYFDRILIHEEPQVTITRMKKALAGDYEDTKVVK